VSYWIFIAAYLDDVCVFCSSLKGHFLHLRAVLQRLREHTLFYKPTECAWGQSEIEFLEYIVSASGPRVHPERSKPLQDWPEPNNIPALRSCLDSFNYWRGYIKQFSDIVAPLVALTRNKRVNPKHKILLGDGVTMWKVLH
jgi:hypothetical protein